MSPFLLKIYSFLVVVTLIITSSLLHNKGTPSEEPNQSNIEISQDNHQETETSATTSKKIISPSAIVVQMVKPENKNTVSPKAVPSPEIQTGESDYEQGTYKTNSCTSPISYTVGSLDPKFNISKSDFLKIVNDSTTLWNEALGKKLFVYNHPENASTISVNLVYDGRQARTDQNKLLSAEIDNSSKAASALEVEYTEMQITFTKLKDEYTALIQNFNAGQKTYNDTVAMWNEKGGAPRDEYEALTREKADLQKSALELADKQQVIVTLLASINAKITKHNELVVFANQRIDENNSGANKKFTEGVYSTGSNTITIYQFSDYNKLKRVLTHEFGHALGIDHVKNKESIMYSVNSATTTILSFEDIQALKAACAQ